MRSVEIFQRKLLSTYRTLLKTNRVNKSWLKSDAVQQSSTRDCLYVSGLVNYGRPRPYPTSSFVHLVAGSALLEVQASLYFPWWWSLAKNHCSSLLSSSSLDLTNIDRKPLFILYHAFVWTSSLISCKEHPLHISMETEQELKLTNPEINWTVFLQRSSIFQPRHI